MLLMQQSVAERFLAGNSPAKKDIYHKIVHHFNKNLHPVPPDICLKLCPHL